VLLGVLQDAVRESAGPAALDGMEEIFKGFRIDNGFELAGEAVEITVFRCATRAANDAGRA